MGNRAGLTMKSYEQRKVNNSKHKNTPQLLRVIKEVKESDLGNEISKLVAKEKNRHSGTEWRVETRHNFQSWSHLPEIIALEERISWRGNQSSFRQCRRKQRGHAYNIRPSRSRNFLL